MARTRAERRRAQWLAMSMVLHVVIGAGIIRLILMPGALRNWLGLHENEKSPVERIAYVAVGPRAPVATPGRSGGDGLPDRGRPATRAPSAVPSGVAPSAPSASSEGGSGRVIGRGGATTGVEPAYADPRVWVGPAQPVPVPRTLPEQLDSILAFRIGRQSDSLALARRATEPQGWLFKRNGKEYGLDAAGNLKIAGLTIPNYLVPKFRPNVSQDPNVNDRSRVAMLNGEARAYSARALSEDELRDAAKEIRARKDRERAAQRASEPRAADPPKADGSR